MSISVDEDGQPVWYAATIVDYGDDNPWKVIYDGFAEVYEFSTEEDPYEYLEESQPRKPLPAGVSMKKVVRRIRELFRVLSISEARRALAVDVSSSTNRVHPIKLEDALIAIRKLSEVLGGDTDMEPDAPGVPDNETVEGDRGGRKWSLTARVRAMCAPALAWKVQANKLMLSEISKDSEELAGLTERLKGLLADLENDDASKYLPGGVHATSSSPSIVSSFIVAPDMNPLKSYLKNVLLVARWRNTRGTGHPSPKGEVLWTVEGHQVNPVAYRKLQAECGSGDADTAIPEIKDLYDTYNRARRWLSDFHRIVPPARTSSRHRKVQSAEHTSSNEMKKEPRIEELFSLQRRAASLQVLFEEIKHLDSLTSIATAWQNSAKKWILEHPEESITKPDDIDPLLQSYKDIPVVIEEGDFLLDLKDFLVWRNEARLLLHKCDECKSAMNHADRPTVETVFEMIQQTKEEMEDSQFFKDSKELARLQEMLEEARKTAELISKLIKQVDDPTEAESHLKSLYALALRVPGVEDNTSSTVIMLKWHASASELVNQVDTFCSENRQGTEKIDSQLLKSLCDSAPLDIAQLGHSLVETVQKMELKLHGMRREVERLQKEMEGVLSQSVFSSVDALNKLVLSVNSSPFSFDQTNQEEIKEKILKANDLEKSAIVQLQNSSLDHSTLEKLRDSANQLYVTFPAYEDLELRLAVLEWMSRANTSLAMYENIKAAKDVSDPLSGSSTDKSKEWLVNVIKLESDYDRLKFLALSTDQNHPAESYAADSSLRRHAMATMSKLCAVSWEVKVRSALAAYSSSPCSATSSSLSSIAKAMPTSASIPAPNSGHVTSSLPSSQSIASSNARNFVKISIQDLHQLVTQGEAMIEDSSHNITSNAPIWLSLKDLELRSKSLQTSVSKTLEESDHLDVIEALKSQLDSSSIEFPTLRSRVEQSLILQHWILEAQVIISLGSSRQDIEVLEQSISSCPRLPVDKAEYGKDAGLATQNCAARVLKELMTLKSGADAWATRVSNILQSSSDAPYNPKPGVITRDAAYYCCLDDESVSVVSKKIGIQSSTLLKLNADRLSGLTISAKLLEGTFLALPEDIEQSLPPEVNRARLLHAQSLLPQTSVKELRKLGKDPVLERVRFSQLEETLTSTIEAAATWEADLKSVLDRLHPHDLAKLSHQDLVHTLKRLESVADSSHKIPAHLKTSKKLNKARELINWFVQFRDMFPSNNSLELDAKRGKNSDVPLLSRVLTLVSNAENNFVLGPTLEDETQMGDSQNSYLKLLRDLSNKCSTWRGKARHALARRKDDNVIHQLINAARKLPVQPETLDILEYRLKYGDLPARGDESLSDGDDQPDPRKLTSQVRWIKYGSFPFWPGRHFPRYSESDLPDYVRNARHKANRRAVYLFGLDIYAWMVPTTRCIKRYHANKDPNRFSVENLLLMKSAKKAAKQFIYEETEQRRKMKTQRDEKEISNSNEHDDGDFVVSKKISSKKPSPSKTSSSTPLLSVDGSLSKKRRKEPSVNKLSKTVKKKSRTNNQQSRASIMIREMTPAQASAQRQLVRKSLTSVLHTCLEKAKQINPTFVCVGTPANIAMAIETALDRLYPVMKRDGLYKNKFKSLNNNLKNPENYELGFGILKGETTADVLVRMNAQQMASRKLKQLRAKTVTDHLDENVVIQNTKTSTIVELSSLHDYGVDNNITITSLEATRAKKLEEASTFKKRKRDGAISSESDDEQKDGESISPNLKKRRSSLPELPKLQSFLSPAGRSDGVQRSMQATPGDELFSDDDDEDDQNKSFEDGNQGSGNAITTIWKGAITTSKKKLAKLTFEAAMVHYQSKNDHPTNLPPSSLSSVDFLHIVGRAKIEKVDKYTRDIGASKKVYIYGLNVDHTASAYVRLMKEYVADRRVGVVTLSNGNAYIVPPEFRNDIQVIRMPIQNIPVADPVVILVLKLSVKDAIEAKRRKARSSSASNSRASSISKIPDPPRQHTKASQHHEEKLQLKHRLAQQQPAPPSNHLLHSLHMQHTTAVQERHQVRLQPPQLQQPRPPQQIQQQRPPQQIEQSLLPHQPRQNAIAVGGSIAGLANALTQFQGSGSGHRGFTSQHVTTSTAKNSQLGYRVAAPNTGQHPNLKYGQNPSLKSYDPPQTIGQRVPVRSNFSVFHGQPNHAARVPTTQIRESQQMLQGFHSRQTGPQPQLKSHNLPQPLLQWQSKPMAQASIIEPHQQTSSSNTATGSFQPGRNNQNHVQQAWAKTNNQFRPPPQFGGVKTQPNNFQIASIPGSSNLPPQHLMHNGRVRVSAGIKRGAGRGMNRVLPAWMQGK